jgi:hypothetical protein
MGGREAIRKKAWIFVRKKAPLSFREEQAFAAAHADDTRIPCVSRARCGIFVNLGIVARRKIFYPVAKFALDT